MIEVYGNIWDYSADVICITTNGYVKGNGAAVMGRGVALQAKQRYSGIEFEIGRLVKEAGNHVWLVSSNGPAIITFPVKHKWNEMADMGLIAKSTYQLMDLIKSMNKLLFVLPRPGCGNGQLSWGDVKPIVSALPDNVHVITNEQPPL